MGRKIATKRKFLSLFIILFALLYYFTNKTIFVYTMSSMLALFLFFDLLDYFSKGKNKFAKYFFRLYPKKREELKSILTDATIFFISTLLMGLFFQKEVVIFSLILLTFVDMSEHIFGKLLPFQKLPWNSQKSFLGTFMGLLIGAIVSYLVITTILENIPLIVILPASIVAAIAGTSKKFDNILIPWCVSIILTILL